jgi:hypothetical protein
MSLIWSIRGVPDDIQALASSAARRERKTIGQWVQEAVEQKAAEPQKAEPQKAQRPPKGAKSRPPAAAETPDLVEVLAEMMTRLEAMEQRMTDGAESPARTTRKSAAKTDKVPPAALRRIQERTVRKG